jgi:magnesium chelatase family protein
MTHEESQNIKEAVERAVRQDQHLWIEAPAGAGGTILARYFHALHGPLPAELAQLVKLTYARTQLEPPSGVPLRAPHHTVSHAGLFGHNGRLGEMHLAAGGVLYLSDVVEFRRSHLDELERNLRELYPTKLVASTMPCPCGHLACVCDADDRERFGRRISAAKQALPVGWATVRLDTALDIAVARELLAACPSATS